MREKKVKVTIADGYHGHHHRGVEKFPGDEIEIWESQEKFLRSLGALAPKRRSRKRKAAEVDEPEVVDEPQAEELSTGGDVEEPPIDEGT